VKAQIPIVVGSIPLKSTFKEFITLKDKKIVGAAPAVEAVQTGDCNNNTDSKEIKIKPVGMSLGYPSLCDPTFVEATTSYSLAAPPPPTATATTNNSKNANGNDSDDDDEEFLTTLKKDACQDFEFVPKYANYTSIHGLDIAELMGPPSGLTIPRVSPITITDSDSPVPSSKNNNNNNNNHFNYDILNEPLEIW